VLWDSDVPGLHVRVGARGATYTLSYRTKSGRQRRPKLGRTSIMSLTLARERARKMLLEVATGNDPAGNTGSLRAGMTIDALADKYMAEYAAVEKKASSAAKDKYLLDSIVRKKWKARKAAEITDADLFELREAMKVTPYHFNRVLALLSTLFNQAEVPWHIRPKGSNPTKGVPRFPEKKRRRYMRADEAIKIAELLEAAREENPASVAFLRLMILTGARPGEIASARWEWLDGAVLRHPDAKTGERDIYLSPGALAVIETLPRTSGTLTGIKSPQKLWQRIRRDAGCPDLRMHDLRRSFASVALSMGYSLAQLGELLGHSSTQTTKGYAYLIEEHKHLATDNIAVAIQDRMDGRSNETRVAGLPVPA
jgi:integrase